MGEEIGSPGLTAICQQQRELLQADLFIASDGPRLNATQPTLFLGSRGCINFRLSIHARDNAYHSGSWGDYSAIPEPNWLMPSPLWLISTVSYRLQR